MSHRLKLKAEYAEGGNKSEEGGQVQEAAEVRVCRSSKHPAWVELIFIDLKYVSKMYEFVTNPNPTYVNCIVMQLIGNNLANY